MQYSSVFSLADNVFYTHRKTVHTLFQTLVYGKDFYSARAHQGSQSCFRQFWYTVLLSSLITSLPRSRRINIDSKIHFTNCLVPWTMCNKHTSKNVLDFKTMTFKDCLINELYRPCLWPLTKRDETNYLGTKHLMMKCCNRNFSLNYHFVPSEPWKIKIRKNVKFYKKNTSIRNIFNLFIIGYYNSWSISS